MESWSVFASTGWATRTLIPPRICGLSDKRSRMCMVAMGVVLDGVLMNERDALYEYQEWLQQTVDEWYGLKVFDAHQTLALKELVHEFEKKFLYDSRRFEGEE